MKEMTSFFIPFAPISLLNMLHNSGGVEQFNVQQTLEHKVENFDSEDSNETYDSLMRYNKLKSATIILLEADCKVVIFEDSNETYDSLMRYNKLKSARIILLEVDCKVVIIVDYFFFFFCRYS